MVVANTIISVVTALLYFAAGGAKVVAQPKMVEMASHFGLSLAVYRLIGVLEILGAVGLLLGLIAGAFWQVIGILAAIGLVLLMLGAFAFHIRAKDSGKDLTPASVGALLSVISLITQIAA